MKRYNLTKEEFNRLTEEKLNECFALAHHDGSDQMIASWNDIVTTVKETHGPAGNLSNISILQKWMEDCGCNGNNTEMLVAVTRNKTSLMKLSIAW